MKRLNIGCGEVKLPDTINIDVEESTHPDIVCDIRNSRLPFEDASFDEVYCIHNIEHIELQFWSHVITEVRRVLKNDGLFVLMYPEFSICAKYFIENHRGMRDFWRACLYGRQLYPGDYHVTAVVSSELENHLRHAGFINVRWGPEDEQPQYSVMKAFKGELVNKEVLLRREIFEGTGVK